MPDPAPPSLYQSPELAALYAKWFTQPIPPKGVNLDIPMSPAMKRAFEKPTDSPDPSTYGSASPRGLFSVPRIRATSAVGHKRTSRNAQAVSALPSIADA